MSESSDKEYASIVIDPVLYKSYAPGATSGPCLQMGSMIPEKRYHPACELCDLGGKRTEFEKNFASEENSTELSAMDAEMEDKFYSQLPPRVLGFFLDRKQWGQMHVDHIRREDDGEMDSNPEKRQESWEGLSLDQKHKENIRALVKNHLSRVPEDEKRLRDHIPGKGEGLVILLHGIPGVGKTMTAESLARIMNRHLLRIDAADFKYDDPAQVSNTFKKFFICAHAWGALLLLDEADVFLQQRKPSGIEQNALVAVLLRELEYFRGVFIMTTNRIVTIDNAVQSRIHYSVLFRKLTESNLKKVWGTFVKQLTDQNCSKSERDKIKEFFKDSSDSLLRQGFTGRDIRNIFTTAQLLDYPTLTLKNLKMIAGCTGDFRESLKDVSRRRELGSTIIDDDERNDE